MRLLITGGTGYLGCRLSKLLIKYGHELFFLLRSGSKIEAINSFSKESNYIFDDSIDFKRILLEKKIEGVIHCATNYGRLGDCPLEIVSTNLLLPLRILFSAAELDNIFFLNIGTLLEKNVSNYSLSKYQLEEWMNQYSNKVKCINVLLEHFYGPNDNPSKFVASVINKLKNKVKKIDLTLGEQKRDFIFIDDVIDAIVMILNASNFSNRKFEEYEVGSGVSVTIRSLVELAKTISGNEETHLNFGAIPYRTNEVMASVAAIEKLQSLGWKPKVSLKEGLAKSFAFKDYD